MLTCKLCEAILEWSFGVEMERGGGGVEGEGWQLPIQGTPFLILHEANTWSETKTKGWRIYLIINSLFVSEKHYSLSLKYRGRS